MKSSNVFTRPYSRSGSMHQTIAVIDLAAADALVPAGTQLDNAVRRFGGLTLLEWTVRRLSESTLLDQTVITGLPIYLSQISGGSLCGARWMPSLHDDPVTRLYDVANRLNPTWIVLVRPICPFLDPTLLDRLISSAWSRPEADSISYISTCKPHRELSELGLLCDVITSQAVEQIVDKRLFNGRNPIDVVRSHPNVFQSSSVPLPTALDRDDLRFVIETAHDWELAGSYLETAGIELTWQKLVELATTDVLGDSIRNQVR